MANGALSANQLQAQKAFFSSLRMTKRKTSEPLVVALVGLVGAGKSAVARELARRLGAAIISGDQIRVALRKQTESYERTQQIALNALTRAIERGGNAVLDADYADRKKRTDLRRHVEKINARLVFVRVHCNFDVMLGRILSATYKDDPDDFFGGASCEWKGKPPLKGAVVKAREMLRRIPHHYDWRSDGGGRWLPKEMPFIFAEVNTAAPAQCKGDIKKCAQKLLAH